MALTVVTAASTHDLTQLATLKAALGISVTTYDTLLARLITAASRAIEAATGRVFAQETVDETLPGSDRYRLQLARTPVKSVTSVNLDDATLDTSEYSIEDGASGALFRAQGWWSVRSVAGWIEPMRTSEPYTLHWTVRYVGGYVLPGGTPGAGDVALPDDIEQACIEAVRMWYSGSGAGAGSPGMKSESIGDYSYTRFDPAASVVGGASFPPITSALLQPYVRMDLGIP
jgi:uncharacterized phiE125 gp8 family phage protein